MNMGQRGVGNLKVLLLVIIMIALGLIGWLVTQRNQPEGIHDKTYYETTKYLKIPEIGIKFELSDDIEDAYYYVSPDSYVYFSLHRYDDQEGMEGCTARGKDGNGGGLMALGSAKLGEEKAGKVWTQAELAAVNATRVGATYYWLDNVPDPCYDPTKVSTETSQVRSISQSKESFLKQQQTMTRL